MADLSPLSVLSKSSALLMIRFTAENRKRGISKEEDGSISRSCYQIHRQQLKKNSYGS